MVYKGGRCLSIKKRREENDGEEKGRIPRKPRKHLPNLVSFYFLFWATMRRYYLRVISIDSLLPTCVERECGRLVLAEYRYVANSSFV
jgi:hypothetical protein